jgi:hypothetical protein
MPTAVQVALALRLSTGWATLTTSQRSWAQGVIDAASKNIAAAIA